MKPATSPQAASAAATTKTTTLERVARAICNIAVRGVNDEVRASFIDTHWRNHLDGAKAALQSLRQVDDETLEAMRPKILWGSDEWIHQESLTYAFTAAIDHILGQEP